MMQRAFTLIETIVAVGLTALIMGVLGMLLVYFYRTNAFTLEQSIAVQQARTGVEDAMTYLREASYGSDGSFPLENAATSSVTFFADMHNTGIVERITYALEGNTFYRIVAEPSGNPLSYVNAALATTTIATSVTNGTSTPVFRYFDHSGNELFPPVNLVQVASVETTIVVDVDVNRAPVAYTLSGGATLRNLREQP